ncbi:MAG TPA: STAS domain-containing protein [Desulfuromonadales bacterium]|nr:STAS domain-containing protein [Desulfuromonadales bacterium]
MEVYTNGTVAYLHGDLTHSGVTHNIVNTLAASLQKLGSGGEKNIKIDCGRVISADRSGLQLLHAWMQCAKFRGVEAKLVNLPERLQQDIQRLSFDTGFSPLLPTHNPRHAKSNSWYKSLKSHFLRG